MNGPHFARLVRIDALPAFWDAPRLRRYADRCAMTGAVTLPLSAAATLDLGFTVTFSYLLAAAAVVLGLPSVARGARRLPLLLVLAAVVVLVIYGMGVLIGSDLGLPGQAGRSRFRDVVYFFDLGLGMALTAFIVDLVARWSSVRPLMVCVGVGAAVVSLYALYQWFAQHYGWAFADVNDTVNSDGVSTGHRDQGAGLFGWERVRATFKEPLLLASYLVLALPLTLALAVLARGRERVVWAVVSLVIAVALTLTVSLLAAAALFVGTLVVGCLFAVQRGARRTAAVLGAACALTAIVGPVLFVDPAMMSGLTGRSEAVLRMTSANRTDAWERATEVWIKRPVFGYGPGQSAVRLAYRPDLGPDVAAPVTFGSAQGLWAAALIDVGIVGMAAWLGLFVAGAWYVARALVARDDLLLVGCATAGLATVVLGQLSGDRLDIRIWYALGIVFAALTSRGPSGRAAAPSNSDSSTPSPARSEGGAPVVSPSGER